MPAVDKRHNIGLSIAKAICIILMVVAHSGCPEWLNRIILLFHMPCFFLISGYFLSEKHIADPKTSIMRKVKSLWWYFVKWTLIFVLLHNLLYAIHINNLALSYHEMFSKIVKSLFMWQSEPLLGTFWFLKDLFISSVLTIAILYALRKYFPGFDFGKYGLLFVCPFLLYATFIEQTSFYPPMKTTAIAIAFYITGVWVRMRFYHWIPADRKAQLVVGSVMLIVLGILSVWFTDSMQSVYFWHVPIYYFTALWGSVAIVMLSQYLASVRKLSGVLDFIGMETLVIMTFHFLSFKAVSYMKILIFDMPAEWVSTHPVIESHNAYFWVIYALAGLGIPLLIKSLLKKIR